MRRSTTAALVGLAAAACLVALVGGHPDAGVTTAHTGRVSTTDRDADVNVAAFARVAFGSGAGPRASVPAGGSTPAPRVRQGTLFLGDSVMLGARPWLARLPGRVNAVESRQVYAGLSIVGRLSRTGRLPDRLVVHLGTNGQFPSYACGDLIRDLGPHRQLFLVTVRVPRSWTADDNRAITRCARRFPNAHLIPWRAFSGAHPAVFASDGYHLSAAGGRAYADLIRASL